MARKRNKTDFTEQNERRQVRELLKRAWAKLEAQRAREREEPKSA